MRWHKATRPDLNKVLASAENYRIMHPMHKGFHLFNRDCPVDADLKLFCQSLSEFQSDTIEY
jgi:hypothetical protein